jgi:hypothetical protein
LQVAALKALLPDIFFPLIFADASTDFADFLRQSAKESAFIGGNFKPLSKMSGSVLENIKTWGMGRQSFEIFGSGVF